MAQQLALTAPLNNWQGRAQHRTREREGGAQRRIVRHMHPREKRRFKETRPSRTNGRCGGQAAGAPARPHTAPAAPVFCVKQRHILKAATLHAEPLGPIRILHAQSTQVLRAHVRAPAVAGSCLQGRRAARHLRAHTRRGHLKQGGASSGPKSCIHGAHNPQARTSFNTPGLRNGSGDLKATVAG